MKPNLRIAFILPFFLIVTSPKNAREENPFATICDIPTPPGYSRTVAEKNTFVSWLRALPLKKNKTVYLYNGLPKINQSAQFAVINISVGNTDLQQCADAVMRLKAEYLYSQKKFNEILFVDNNKTKYKLGTLHDRVHFDDYLHIVFARCGTLSLENQLVKLNDRKHLEPGDVLIQGGSPGHAMIVIDMARTNAGKTVYMLAQSYMPAQDIHIVINPATANKSPWYELNDEAVSTPEWVFPKLHFRTWPQN